MESFTPGRDGGIDLRFAKVKGRDAIVQAKRYKTLSSLMENLRKEALKVKDLKPARYILSTSVGLTPKNKADIQTLFSPFILCPADILGRDDLNNLLGQYPDVEKQHNKLWLGSTAVLESILNKRIENWSAMELEEARRDISVYVMNESFNKATKILMENRYIIISGIPGIGKTTLARMLAYDILAKGYEEFIKVGAIDDAAQKLVPGKKQIFFYDDFLGSSFLEEKESGFEGKVLSFIEKVKRELAKCTLDLSYYSEEVRALILYNHLAMAELPEPYVRALLAGRQYLKLIRHNNFNPRIIEAFLNKKYYLSEAPDAFVSRFMDFFDKPYSVWEFAFAKMSDLAKCALWVRATMGGGYIYLDDWKEALDAYVQGVYKQDNEVGQDDWMDVIRDLQGTFIITEQSDDGVVVRYNNPSVYDFLLDYLRQRALLYTGLIRYAIFTDQVTGTFTDKAYDNTVHGRIVVTQKTDSAILTALNRMCEKTKGCKVFKGSHISFRYRMNKAIFLTEMLDMFPVFFRRHLEIISGMVNHELFLSSQYELRVRMKLLDKIDTESCNIDLNDLTERIVPEIEESDDFVDVMGLLKRTEKGQRVLEDRNFIKRIEDAFSNELDSASSLMQIDSVRDNIEALSESIPGIDKNVWHDAADEASDRLKEEDPSDYTDWDQPEVRVKRDCYSDYYDIYSSLLN